MIKINGLSDNELSITIYYMYLIMAKKFARLNKRIILRYWK